MIKDAQPLKFNIVELFPRLKNESEPLPRSPQCAHCMAEFQLKEFKQDLMEVLIKHFK
jgi:hypothetical protein